MTFEALLDHHGVVYQATETRDELGDVIEVWTALPAPAGNNCRPNQNWQGSLTDHGPGEQQAALRQWFLHKDFVVAERNVISITEGPNAPMLLRVVSVTPATAPKKVHHLEVNVEVWHGSLA